MDKDLTLNINAQTFHRDFTLQESGIKELHEITFYDLLKDGLWKYCLELLASHPSCI